MVHSKKHKAAECNAACARQTPEQIEKIRQFQRMMVRAHGLQPVGGD